MNFILNRSKGEHNVAPFFLGLFFYVYIESLNPKLQKAPHHRPQTPSTENPNPKKLDIRP